MADTGAHASGTDETGNEFRFLVDEAAEFGIDSQLPDARRDSVEDRNGRTVSFIEWGQGGPVATFLHGAGLNAHTWDATIMSLGLPAVALDLPGHGSSDWRDDADYRAETNADAVTSVFERLGADCQVLVGQSLGGLTGAVVAARNPGAVSGLVIVDITPGLDTGSGAQQVQGFLAGPSDFASRAEIVERARAYGIGVSQQSVERGVALNTRIREDGRVVFSHHLANLGGLAPVIGDLASVWPFLERLTIPVLLVRASGGILDDALEQEFLTRVPGSRSVTLDAGHNIQEDIPVELAAIIASFIEHTPGQVDSPTATKEMY
jgi:pimeloyl-ACP methyl ester carboxylesterase